MMLSTMITIEHNTHFPQPEDAIQLNIVIS
ncbi:uncharacterized protein METZ01_LOCUS512366 [marine metagenome]|uniref:Uncharacterized protein n=1 Tax=marine metagenome TaxID=408172 RepID=A0A383ERC8_9ZZZZ